VDKTVQNKERKLGTSRKYFFLYLCGFYSASNSSFFILTVPSLGTEPKGNFEEEIQTIKQTTSRKNGYIRQAGL
jgi:hypothetical protein